MSTTKSDSSRFNILLPLFQPTDASIIAIKGAGAVPGTPAAIAAIAAERAVPDSRPKLYLDLLQTAFEKEFAKGTGVVAAADAMVLDPATMYQLQNQYYEPKDAGAANNMHSEWGEFHYDLVNQRLAGQKTDAASLAIIKGLAGADPLSNLFNLFSREVIKAHFVIKGTTLATARAAAGTAPATTDDITDEPTQWGTVASIEGRGLTRIFPNPLPGGGTSSLALIATALAKGTAARAAVVGPPPVAAVVALPATDTLKKVFNYRLKTFVLHQILENAGNVTTSIGDSFWGADDVVSNTYYRLASDRSKLYTTDASGNKIDVSKGSAYFADKIKDGKNCSSFYVKENGAQKCDDYLLKCITRGDAKDISACREYMDNADFWDATQKEVDEMLPTNAEDTLRRFGFQTESRNNLTVFQSIGDWFKHIESQIGSAAGATGMGVTKAELENIMKNDKLKGYLGMLISKVNSNPSILNKNYNTPYGFDAVDHQDAFKGWGLTAMGLKPRLMIEQNKDASYIGRLSNVISSNLLTLGTSMKQYITLDNKGGILVGGLPYALYPHMSIKMYGGGEGDEMYGGNYAVRSSGQTQLRQNYPLLKTLFDYVEKRIESKGKSLDSVTKTQIAEHLEKYKQYEEKLFKAIRYTDKYLDLVEIYGHYDKDNILSIDHLKKFVEARDKYYNKANGKQNEVVNAIEQVGNILLEAIKAKA